jgi:hypothetical protein
MGRLSAETRGRADGRRVSALVAEALASGGATAGAATGEG